MERQGETGTEMNGDQEADTGQGMREKETEMDTDREGEKHHCVVASCVPPTGDLACNPGM